MEVKFGGRKALVTGGAQGIGKAISCLLLKCGCRVTILDRDEKTLQKAKAEAPALSTMCCDLLDCEGTMAAVKEASIEEPFTYLVNCAGVAIFEKYFDTSLRCFDLQYNVNVRPAVYLTQAFAAALQAKGLQGAVVHISSQSSTISLPDHLVYSSGKAAVDHIARIQALELGPLGIRVNTVRPTVVMTELALKNWEPEKLEVMKSQIPLRQCATPDDVASAVVWLLSDHARMVTGIALPVDGGRSMGGFGL